MDGPSEPTGPFGEPRSSRAYQEGVRAAARDALAALARHRSGELDALMLCRELVNDAWLREIAPHGLLAAFIGAEARFDLDLDPERAHLFEPGDWADLCRERDAWFESAEGSIERDCDALRAHLEAWQRAEPPTPPPG